MANEQQLDLLRSGTSLWNQWRQEHPALQPDLYGADLCNAPLSGAQLGGTNLSAADLSGANLSDVDFIGDDLAEVCGVNLDADKR
ncbi:MAG: pentapeptide repeat-containing protein [Chloroflexota bacterium]|nr:pentapeptide repeat-containing protein [Chloroflexota bacterium]